jgi:hypothetical protein
VTPDPQPTLLERADELDVAARIAYDKHDYVFAKQLADHAHLLRMQEKQEVRDAAIHTL